MEWFRFYTRTLDCRKVQSLPPSLFKAWVNLLCICSLHGGALPPIEEISFRLRCSEPQVTEWLNILSDRGLIDKTPNNQLVMHDWNEHQYVSDCSTERVRKHRTKQSGNVSVTPPDSEQNQNRTEQTQNGALMPPAVREIMPNATSEYPLTIAEIRKHDPAVDEQFVRGLVTKTIQHCLSSKEFPQDKIGVLTDKNMARLCRESYTTGPPGHRTGLLLNRVPPIAVTWAQERKEA